MSTETALHVDMVTTIDAGPTAELTAASLSTVELYRELLRRLGEDPARQGLVDTPGRMEKAMAFLTQGYAMDVTTVLNDALFEEKYDEMVIVKEIEFYSAHVAYVPNGRVIGLSKIPRLVEMFARRLQVQERMTTEIADAIAMAIAPQGVGVVVEAEHLCMMMRGVQTQRSTTVTSAMRGVFKTQVQTRNEFLSLIGRSGREA